MQPSDDDSPDDMPACPAPPLSSRFVDGTHGYARDMRHRILVALDESEASRRAAQFVNNFLRDVDVEVLALNVADVVIPWYPGIGTGAVMPYPFPPLDPAAEEELVDKAEIRGRRIIEDSGIANDESLVEFGDPVETIQAAASEHGVDLVVIGATEKGWWSRLLQGSTSETIIRRSDCPVLVVP
jgi:nucleotide-binding universal stress UspA family protein